MKTIQIITLLFGISLGIQNIQSQEYKLDTKNSTFTWTGKAALNTYSLTGTLKAKEGNLSMKGVEISNLNVTIDMKSLDHKNKDLKNHLKNEDFFEVKTYPKAIFLINNPVIIESEKSILTGDLTIKGQTNTEKIVATIKKTSMGITLKFGHTIDRTKYGVSHNSPSLFKRMKENAIADEFVLEGTLIFK